MSENEIMLIEMIKNHSDPEKALNIAIEVIIDYLSHLEPSESISPVVFRELA